MDWPLPNRIVLLILVFHCGSAASSGIFLREFGQPAQGASGAGGNVWAKDASTAFQNPAGLFWLPDDSEWMVTGFVLDSKVEFEQESGTTIPGNDGGDAGDTLPGGAFFHTRRLSEQWGLALSLTSVAGSALTYDQGFVGRYTGRETELLTVTLTPSIAYKINEDLSLAMGIPIIYGKLDLDADIPPLIGPPIPSRDGLARISNGDDWSATLSASLLWQASDRVRVAVAYLGENELSFGGDLEVTLPGFGGGTTLDNIVADVDITFPQALSVSTAFQITDQLNLAARLGWEEWSALDSVPISTGVGGTAFELDWDDTWSLALGLRYEAAGPWTFYTGAAYDSDPTEPTRRISILPADEQWRYSVGTTYRLGERRKLGAVLSYIDLGDARFDTRSDVGAVVGEFSTNRIIMLGINFAW